MAIAAAVALGTGCDTLTGLKRDMRGEGAAVLRLDIAPTPGLAVRVDGEPVAADTAAAGIRLAPGGHRVEIEAPGHHPFAFPVELEAGDTLSVPIALRPEGPRPPPAPPAR